VDGRGGVRVVDGSLGRDLVRGKPEDLRDGWGGGGTSMYESSWARRLGRAWSLERWDGGGCGGEEDSEEEVSE